MSNKWPMTDAEIRDSWRRCEDKTEQVKILAQLNNRAKEDMIEKLTALGIEVPEETMLRNARFTPEEDRIIWLWRQEGKPYKEIARKIGRRITIETVKRRYTILLQEHQEARPFMEEMLRAAVQGCTDERRKIIEQQIKRGI